MPEHQGSPFLIIIIIIYFIFADSRTSVGLSVITTLFSDKRYRFFSRSKMPVFVKTRKQNLQKEERAADTRRRSREQEFKGLETQMKQNA